MSIVVFGAGAIGRGLLGELAARANVPVTFVEAVPELATQLAAAGRYSVRLVGREESETVVTNYRVLTPADQPAMAVALRDCAFAATAVGGQNLGAVADLVNAALPARATPLRIVVCENWPNADGVLREALRQRCSGGSVSRRDGTTALDTSAATAICIPSSVERMVQRAPGTALDLIGESIETAWVQARLPLPGLNTCADVTPYYARKLYTNNAGHALLAYEGFLAGHETLCAAVADPAIRARLEELLAVAARMLEREYGLAAAELREHVDCLVRYRFANVALADRVERVARQPLRKLGPQERLVGLLRKLEKHRLPIAPVCRTIGAALHYFHEADSESARLREWGAERVLVEVCGLPPGEEAYRLCRAAWQEIEDRRGCNCPRRQ